MSTLLTPRIPCCNLSNVVTFFIGALVYAERGGHAKNQVCSMVYWK
jgi:hypothetical protein